MSGSEMVNSLPSDTVVSVAFIDAEIALISLCWRAPILHAQIKPGRMVKKTTTAASIQIDCMPMFPANSGLTCSHANAAIASRAGSTAIKIKCFVSDNFLIFNTFCLKEAKEKPDPLASAMRFTVGGTQILLCSPVDCCCSFSAGLNRPGLRSLSGMPSGDVQKTIILQIRPVENRVLRQKGRGLRPINFFSINIAPQHSFK